MNILLIGVPDRREFREARLAMDACGAVVEAADIAGGCAVLSDGELAPDVIVLATAYPGQFSSEAVDRLRRLAPLSRVVALLGAWCEGEARSGYPPPGVIRVYWHQWAQRLGWEAARWHDGVRSSWALPVTAAEEERVLALAETPFPGRAEAVKEWGQSPSNDQRRREIHKVQGGLSPFFHSLSGLIAVCSQEFAVGDWLCAACRKAGYSTEWLRPGGPLHNTDYTAGVFDTDDQPQQYEELRRFAAALTPAPVIALMGFPRIEDRDRARAAGAAAVLSKPLLVEDLFWAIDRVRSVGQTS